MTHYRSYLLSFLIALLATATDARIFVVDTAADLIDALPNGQCSPCSLRAAIMEANRFPDTDVIFLPALSGGRSYRLNRFGSGLANNIQQDQEWGDLDIQGQVTIVGWSEDPVAIEGYQALGERDRIFEIYRGGDVLLMNLELHGSDLRNQAEFAFRNDGGAVFAQLGTRLEIVDSVLRDNAADLGGAILALSQHLLLQRTTVARNTATEGGGIVWSPGSPDHAMVLERTTVHDNRATGKAVDHGGGGLLIDRGHVRAVNSTISGNRADRSGGGILAFDGTISLANVTLAFNQADADADGSGNGGGFVSGLATVEIKNSIVGRNGGRAFRTPFGVPFSLASDCLGTFVSGRYNVLQFPSINGCQPSGLLLFDRINADPQLAVLGSAGARMPVHDLLLSSPAIDNGDPGLGCRYDHDGNPGTADQLLRVDQRGQPRPAPAMGRCDSGAVEFNP